ncbi:hypothetical protein, partial [Streptomyces sp. AcH 505]|uniref:hypothetical protein n=1 Tax=Streptomyces sp. AcH 505 TaxID=352211 RepID=UPI0018E2D077
WSRRAAPPTPRVPPAPPAPPRPPDIHVHVDVHLDPSAWLPVPVEPEPGPPWWIRARPGYQAACILAGLPLTGWWDTALVTCRAEAGLAAAWVVALVPLAVVGYADNVYRVAAAGAAPELWAPRIRAAAARTLLWALTLATVLALPVTTVVYLLTGVRP